MSLSISDFLYTQLILKIPQPTASFASKTVIVTGANSGLGKEAAKHIVALGATKVILACRDITKAKAAKLEIETSLKCSLDVLEVWQLDLESNTSVKEFADRASKLDRLDVLLNNAGVMALKYQTVDGMERCIAVNVVGTFLLSLLLVPKLQETARVHGTTPHLTIVASALASVAKWPEDLPPGGDIFEWQGKEENVPDVRNQYNLSKLLQIFVVRQLSTLISPPPSSKSPDANPIVINCLDPCFCRSELGREARDGGFALKVAMKAFTALFARTTEEGSRLLVIAASAGGDTHGGYMRGGKLKEYAEGVTGEVGKERERLVWEQLGKRLEGIQPGILANVNKAP